MLKITQWTPDTCRCVLHYQWDNSVPAEQRVHTPIHSYNDHEGKKRATKLCLDHRHLSNDDIHTVVVEENQRKNAAIAVVIESVPEAKASDYTFTMDASRNVVIKHIDEKDSDKKDQTFMNRRQTFQSEKKSIQSKLSEKFGSQVILE